MQPPLKRISRRSRKRIREYQRPVLQLPVPAPEAYREPEDKEPTAAQSQSRGIAVIDFYV